MSDAVWAARIGGAAGLATGIVGSLAAPWVTWRVERERATRTERRALLDTWRTELARAEREDLLKDRTFLQDGWYQSLRTHLHPDVVGELEYIPRITGGLVGNARTNLATTIADELDRIARDWKLP